MQAFFSGYDTPSAQATDAATQRRVREGKESETEGQRARARAGETG